MKCIISNSYLKLFGRSIHCLSKIGDELFLEALSDGLALRSVNSSRSAYACFNFTRVFFYEYDQGCEFIDNSNPAEMLKCKLSMKSCLNIFKSLQSIEKNVDQCKIEFRPDECRLIFTLFCKYGITKTYNLTYQESESLQAIFSKELCPNMIVAQSKVLQDTVLNFPNNCEEIVLTVCPQFVKIKNYVEPTEPDFSKVVNTEMTLAPEEFDNFQIGIDTEVTFCLKELRAILAFTEFVNQPLALHFEHPGKPIIFALDNDEVYEGHFVMATLCENNSFTQQSNVSVNLHASSIQTDVKALKSSSTVNLSSALKNSSAVDSSKHIRKEVSTKNNLKRENFQKSKSQINFDNNFPEEDADPFFSESCPYTEFMKVPSTSNVTSSLSSSFINLKTSINDSVTKEVHSKTPHSPVKKKSKFFDDSDNTEYVKNKEIQLLCADTDDESS
ncbi:cell cycle checkpoint control protein RAD9A [Hydra vulgaris]|uniref:Cell cycle checkpoint control protein n=1 Tax=Hydra vulgaris TaxID=6087 RepID=T2M799_HYDVU|nr:cell cycle checkpoint control protein RAD9A [Hydra vulgaris]XP_047132342.1 cell cycle checkpoint control protein RAD9A [Hydra vulgaris]